LVEPFGAHGGRFAKRPYSDKANDSPHRTSGFECFCIIQPTVIHFIFYKNLITPPKTTHYGYK
ncbi:MAG: hypothetical protein MSH66_04280, partial [Bacteroidales bacterium]|nr:hypothetical protein [Bacteroidales bacterium]